MKKAYKIISLLLCLFVVLISICSKPIKVEATGGHFGQNVFTKGWTWTNSNGATFDAYSMEDTTNLPEGYFYFYKIRDGECIALEASEVITNILNNKVGIIGSLNMIADFILQYTSDHFGWSLQDTPVSGTNIFPDATRVVIKGSTLIGVAMNDLTGCRLVNSSNNQQSVSVPNDVVNSVYNYYTYVYLEDNPETPDYINVPCATKNTAIEGGLLGNKSIAYFDSPAYTYNFGYSYSNIGWRSSPSGTDAGYLLVLEGDSWYFVAEYTSVFDEICETYGLTQQNYQISLTAAIVSTNTTDLLIYPYDKTTNEKNINRLSRYSIANSEINNINEGYAKILGNRFLPYSSGKEYITVYRTANTVTQITNNVYAPRSYQTTNYKNYSTSNNNSYTTNVQSINNSSSNNTTIYNDTKTENNETIVEDSYNVNNTTITNNTTNITNNYYGDNGGGSGGGDDNGDDDDDDDTIWKALLKAIGDFLKKIGELIATILTGLVSILTSVLDAIANITTNFTGVTTFISSVFGFLPSDVLAVITLGITLGILISLIKMFGK